MIEKIPLGLQQPQGSLDLEAVLQAREANPTNCTLRVYHHHNFGKSILAAKLCLTLLEYCKTFDSL